MELVDPTTGILAQTIFGSRMDPFATSISATALLSALQVFVARKGASDQNGLASLLFELGHHFRAGCGVEQDNNKAADLFVLFKAITKLGVTALPKMPLPAFSKATRTAAEARNRTIQAPKWLTSDFCADLRLRAVEAMNDDDLAILGRFLISNRMPTEVVERIEALQAAAQPKTDGSSAAMVNDVIQSMSKSASKKKKK